LEKGFASGALGTGPQAERHKRLRDLVAKRLEEEKKTLADDERQALAAKDGNALVNVGMNLVFNGQAAKGLQLMQQGVAKGGLKRPDDAKLHVAIAYLIAGDSATATHMLSRDYAIEGVVQRGDSRGRELG
jgi:Tfp pilus assembly protein PilF